MIYPLKDKTFLTQLFGENPKIYSRFNLKGHNGLDFRTKYPDTPLGRRYVYASLAGVVSEIKNQGNSGYGLFIRLGHNGDEQTVYGHLFRTYVKVGQRVTEGEKIGLTDNTGFSTGAHLHFGYRPKGFNYNNGFAGYVDPLPYLKNPISSQPSPTPVMSKEEKKKKIIELVNAL